MKKNKFKVTIVAAIAAVAIVSGSIFAWFVSDTQSEGINVGTGSIEFTLGLPSNTNVTNILPGESSVIPDFTVKNNGTRDAFAKVSMKADDKIVIGSLGIMTVAEFDEIDAKFPGDYKQDATGKVTLTTQRLEEVIALVMTDTTDWVSVASEPNVYYTVVPSKGEVVITGLTVEALSELGGNLISSSSSVPSPDRFFEMRLEVDFNIEGSAIQATQTAIRGVYTNADEILAAAQLKFTIQP